MSDPRANVLVVRKKGIPNDHNVPQDHLQRVRYVSDHQCLLPPRQEAVGD